ncbi:lysylphosphatidylglycerol synthase transmembrane domain-containing protein [Verrucomicrobiota bacterium sgz303538]
MKKTLLTLLQIAVTLGVLYLLFRSPEKRAEMLRVIEGANQAWLAVGAFFYIVVEILSGIRWQLLLRVQGVQIGWVRLYALVFIGVFFNFFIPGGTGGDVVKIFFLLKETPGQRGQALLATLMDRLLGLVAMVMLAGVIIALQWSWLTSSSATTNYVWTALAILGGSMLAIGFSFLVSGFKLVHRLPERFPGRDRLAEFSMAYNLYSRAWPITVCCLLISVAAHLFHFTTFYSAARALTRPGMHIPSLAEIYTIMPVVNTITSLPVSVGGLGVREGLFQIFLGHLAKVSDAVAVVISSAGFVLTAVSGAIGGVCYLLYRPSEHARLREIRSKVADVEHEVAETEIALEEEEEESAR